MSSISIHAVVNKNCFPTVLKWEFFISHLSSRFRVSNLSKCQLFTTDQLRFANGLRTENVPWVGRGKRTQLRAQLNIRKVMLLKHAT